MKTETAPPLLCQRGEFELPESRVYLNCAYMGPLITSVGKAGTETLLKQRYPSSLSPSDYYDYPDNVRSKFNRLINGDGSSHVAIVPSVSYAMASVAKNISVSRKQNIVVVAEEFPSGVLEWRKLARNSGAELRTVSAADEVARRGESWNELILNSIDSSTAVVVVPNVHWSDGTIFNLKEISEKAKATGAVFCVDGTQSIGALPFDWSEIKPDLLVAAGYKWLFGGYGLAVAHFSERLKDGLPLDSVWTSQLGSENFSELSRYSDSYVNSMSRYDGGQRASFTLNAMLSESLDRLLEWEPERVQLYCSELMGNVPDMLRNKDMFINETSHQARHLFGIRYKGGWSANDIVKQLYARGFDVSCRGDAIRVSTNLYNTVDDLNGFMNALMKLV